MKPQKDADSSYRYKGIPPSPSIVAELTKQLFAGQLVDRQKIIDGVRNFHVKHGGSPPQVTNFANTVKKALADMKKIGDAENPSSGYWKILPASTDFTLEHAAVELPVSIDEPSISAGSRDDVLAEVVLGSGPSSVYLYYLPSYRIRAEERGEHSWPCKIGRSEQDPLQRVLAQAGTALPEKPVVAVLLRTNYSAALEKAFHGVLTLRGLAVRDAPGVEWFLTSPDEFVALAKLFDPKSFDTPRRA